MEKYLSQTENTEVKYWIEHNLKNYLKDNVENISEIEHILDFFNSTNPTRLRKMSYKQAVDASKTWLKAEIKKGNDIDEGITDLETIIDFKDGYKLVRLIGENAFKREGFLMSHCVGSYVRKIGTAIYSLRDSKNMPHCTIEVQGKVTVTQIKGKGNGSIHPNYIMYILKTLDHFNVKVRDSEMENLGYVNLENVTSGFNQFVMETVKGVKWFEYKKIKYVCLDSLK